MGAQPGPAPDEQRRRRHRHPRRDAGTRPRHQAVRRIHVGGRRPGAAAPRSRATRARGSISSTAPPRCCAPYFTVNTDFAQTEVDQRQVNLTRFSLFFPERRDFFLDGATFFDFRSDGQRGFFCCGGNNDDQVIPFFSRRIGLSASGTPQKIDFGTKITGQVGAQDVGILHVRTGEDESFTSEDFTVARVKRRILAQSYLGAIYTRRDPLLDGSEARHTTGLDMSLSTSSFRGSQNLEAAAWFLQRDAARGVAWQLGVRRHHRLSERSVWNARLDATRDSGALRPVDRFRAAHRISGSTHRRSGFSRGRKTADMSDSTRFATQPGLHDRSRQRPADAPDRRDAAPRELTVAGQLQHQYRQLPRAARHAVRHQPRHHAAPGRRVRLHALPDLRLDRAATDDRHQPPLRDRWLLLRHPHRAAGQPVGAAAPRAVSVPEQPVEQHQAARREFQDHVCIASPAKRSSPRSSRSSTTSSTIRRARCSAGSHASGGF